MESLSSVDCFYLVWRVLFELSLLSIIEEFIHIRTTMSFKLMHVNLLARGLFIFRP